MAARAVFLLILLQAILLYYDGVASSTAFGCKNAMIPDEWRNMVLNHHNEFRRKLAKGLQAGSTGAALPYATKMSQLYWDCNVEELAREQADKCPTTTPNVATYGNSFATIPAKGTCNTTAKIEDQIKSWWKDGAKKQANNAKVAGNDLFSQMAYEETTIVACSYKFCSGSLALVCLYNKDGAAQQNLYTSSNNKADICNACIAAAPCENALCNQRPAPVALEVKQCTGNAKKDLMTDDLRDQALNIHNYYRRLLATGWAKDAKLGYAKPATAMPKLVYDCDVENTIMTAFETCGGNAANTGKAENFVAYGDYQSERGVVLSKVLADWWAPLENTGNPDNTYTDANAAALKTYINMAHHETVKVGCGVQTCAKIGKTLVQCAYDGAPPAPDDAAIYTPGKPCSKCKDTAATKSCSPLGGLCIA